jgi:hypothetical protein
MDTSHLQPQPAATPPKAAPERKGETEDRLELDRLRAEARQKRIAYLESLDPKLPAMIEEWKKGFNRVESIHILGTLYIYRNMTRGEYIALMQQGQDKIKNDEMVASKCLLWPKIEQLAWVTLPAGLPTTISDLVLTSSGFGAEDPVPIRL